MQRWHAEGTPRVLPYRCTKPAGPPKGRAERDQRNRVFDFFEALEPLGIVHNYETPETFAADLRDHLISVLDEIAGAPPGDAAPAGTDAFDLAGYLEHVDAECGSVPLGGMLGDKNQPDLELADVYVSLSSPRPLPERGTQGRVPDFDAQWLQKRKNDEKKGPLTAEEVRKWLRQAGAERADLDDAYVAESLAARIAARWSELSAESLDALLSTRSFEEVVRRHAHVVIEGDPGSGKTTSLKAVAMALVRAHRDHGADSADASAMGFAAPWPVPVFVPLRRFAAHLATTRDAAARDTTCAADLTAWLRATVDRGGEAAWLDAALRDGRAVLLFDGLDEVSDAALRHTVVRVLRQWVRDHEGNRCLVATRPVGLEGSDRRTLLGVGELGHATVLGLDEDQMARFVRAWYRAVIKDQAEAARRADNLLGRLRASDGNKLLELARTPILLTAILIVHRTVGELPDRQADLYDRAVNVLAHLWDFHRDETARMHLCGSLGADAKVAILAEAAWRAHTAGADNQRVSWPELVRILASAQRDPAGREPSEHDCRLQAEQLADRSGILVPDGDGLRFRHLQFQEFLVARWLASYARDPVADLAPRLAEPWWKEVGVLTPLAKAIAQPADAHHLVEELGRWVLEHEGDLSRRANALGVLAEALVFLRRYPDQGHTLQPTLDTLRPEMARLVEHEEQPGERPRRWQMATCLGWFGDPRLETHSRWVELPPGEAWLGRAPGDSDPGYLEEPEGRWVPHEQPVLIQRWPVTRAEWEEFRADGGYACQDWWDDDGWAWRQAECVEAPGDSEWQRQWAPTTPVVGVSFWEARAYCRWLTARGGAPRKGWVVALPTEPQWEYASRGPRHWPDGQANPRAQATYPWGDVDDTADRCNGVEARLPGPSPVGLFPKGHAAAGAWDLAGNVWEWTDDTATAGDAASASAIGMPPRPRESRVLRGGGWRFGPRSLRVSCRGGGDPRGRGVDFGFRCVAVLRPLDP